jgi:Uma2 family endonuclease
MSAILEQVMTKAVAGPSDNDVLYEVVNGQRVEQPPMGAKENSLASVLHFLLSLHLQTYPVGRAFQEMLFCLDHSGRLERRPDVSVVLFERWPDRIVPDTDSWRMVPALAVEVVSKSNTALELLDKVYDYFNHGVGLVWLVFPRQQLIYVYESPKRIRVLDSADTLDGGAALPELRVPVAKLFEQPATLP